MKASFYVFSSSVFRGCVPLLLLLGLAGPGLCQTPQQHVYATGTGTNNPSAAVISGFDQNSISGSLSPIPTSPFPAHEAAPMAVDGQGKFLFVAGPTSIAMDAIDSASGALSEVPRSPFPYIPTINPSQTPSNPLSIATEPSGKYVYVGFQNGPNPQTAYGSITPYVIDTSNAADPVLDLGPQLELDFSDGAPSNLFVEPTGRHLYVALGNSGGNSYAGFDLYDIDGNSGELYFRHTMVPPGVWARASAMDPKGRFLFQAVGQYGSTLTSFALSPVDGSEAGSSTVLVSYNAITANIVVDPSGSFLYAYVDEGPLGFNTYSIDQSTGALTLLNSSTQMAFPFGLATVADPQGQYLYTLLNGALHGFQVDATSGTLSELSSSPFTDGSSNYYATGLYLTNTKPQASSGPYLEVVGGGTFPQTPVGTTSPQLVTVGLSNIGDLPLTLSSILIANDTTNSFSVANPCPAVLAASASCQVTISFTPAAIGLLQATLQITDTAPGSPQSVAISGVGTGSTNQPQATLSASNLSFGSQTQGTSSAPQVVTLTNSSNATLHLLSGVTLGGTFAKDWTQTNTCSAPLAAQASCMISVTFSPSDNGILSASITLTDDAPNSPQTISLYGNAPPAALLGPATSGGSTVATVLAGNTAIYNLQVVPGPSFAGTINLSCTGVPFGAQCTVPASLSVVGGAVVPFTVTISTLSPSQAALLPWLPHAPSGRLRPQRGIPLAFLAALLLFALTLRSKIQMPAQARCLASVTTLLLVTALVFSGIGCGSAGSVQTQLQPPLQSAATPAIQPASGTFTAAQTMTITDATVGATIHYTTDGSTPTASSSTYQAAVSVSSLTTVQAMATAPNYANSGVASATFKFQTPSGTITITPTATPNGSTKPLPLTPIQLTLNVQ
jgi:6-phosphogluconolactonase (cycloisomerase 2 family)